MHLADQTLLTTEFEDTLDNQLITSSEPEEQSWSQALSPCQSLLNWISTLVVMASKPTKSPP